MRNKVNDWMGIAQRAAQPCECHLTEEERKFTQDPFGETCVPCHARELYRLVDEYVEQYSSTIRIEMK
jgi:hypothetical protein